MVKNLLKKVCLVVSVLLGLGSNVQAQETASVTFTEDGKTLTISGQGDLTTYSGDVTVTIFAEAANNKVSLNSGGGEITGQTYHPATQYYAFNSETNKWDVISDNESYFAEHPTYLENKVQKISFVQMLANQLKNNYETVRFVNDEPATPMYVDEEGDEYPYFFVCQINLEEIASYDVENRLPHKGLLSFFAKIDYYMGYSDVYGDICGGISDVDSVKV